VSKNGIVVLNYVQCCGRSKHRPADYIFLEAYADNN